MEKPSLQTQVEKPPTEKNFGGYTMLEHLGKGGMGDVYRANQVGLNRIVAIKILPSLLARSSEFSERFFTEAYAISRLQHQNIVTIYDYGDEDGQKFIAMQYVQGTTLSRIIKDSKSLDFERIIGITKQICRGLKYAHQNDIVHRDIKSGNIMIEPGDKVYISDFGIAKVIDAPSITTTGMAMGTPEYMSPEQCEGGIVDGQSDIYGLGIIIYEMVTGRPPFLADTPLAVAYKQVHDIAPLLGKKRANVPPRLELIVAKCLKKNKADRYLSADALLQDLDSAHIEMGTVAIPTTPIPSDLRITDRRDHKRRHANDPMSLSRGYLWGILGLFLLILSVLTYILIRPAPLSMVGMRWLIPQLQQSQPPSDNKGETEITFTFPGKVLLTSLVLETGLLPAKGSKAMVLELDGKKPVRFTLQDGGLPQVFNLGGVLVEKGTLRFNRAPVSSMEANSATRSLEGSPDPLKVVRFVGLPYD